MSTWRYVQNGQPSAPVDTAALQALLTQGVVSPDSYVWKEGMTNWLAAKNLPEFANCRPPTVPPGTARLRVCLSAAHDVEQIEALVAALHPHRASFVRHG